MEVQREAKHAVTFVVLNGICQLWFIYATGSWCISALDLMMFLLVAVYGLPWVGTAWLTLMNLILWTSFIFYQTGLATAWYITLTQPIRFLVVCHYDPRAAAHALLPEP